jgi:hypothetical protein
MTGLGAARDFALSPSRASGTIRTPLKIKALEHGGFEQGEQLFLGHALITPFTPWAADPKIAVDFPPQRSTACRALRPRSAAWHHQREASFSDATAAVRRLFWSVPNGSMSRHDPDGVEILAALWDTAALCHAA